MGATAGALMAVSSIVVAGGQLLQGYQQKQTYDYNAAVARQEAKYAQQKASIEETQFRRDLAAQVARQRALQGMSGTTGGSNIDALARTIRQGEYDAQLIRYGGSVDSWRAGSASDLYSSAGGKMLTSGIIGAGGTLLTAGSKFDWKRYGQTKKFGDLFR